MCGLSPLLVKQCLGKALLSGKKKICNANIYLDFG